MNTNFILNVDSYKTSHYLQYPPGATTVSSYVESFKREELDDVSKRKITLPWMKPDQWLEPQDYLIQFALPNFYFHVVTAYSILRHKGVQLGKSDYIGGVPIQG